METPEPVNESPTNKRLWSLLSEQSRCQRAHGGTLRGESVYAQLAGQRQRSPWPCIERNWSISCSQEEKIDWSWRRACEAAREGIPKKKTKQKKHIIVLSLARLELPNTWQAATKERRREQNNTESEDLEKVKADKRATRRTECVNMPRGFWLDW